MDFYDEIAGFYDDMTDLSVRKRRAAGFVDTLAQRYSVGKALDVACGTGTYTVALAERGIDTVGADISAAMLEHTSRLAEQEGVKPELINCPMQRLGDHTVGPFDLIICLGNSLPHLLSDEDLDSTLSGFSRLLDRQGVVIVHLLNFAALLAANERVVAITRKDDAEYIRFYDFMGDYVNFNLLRIDWQDGGPRHDLHSTRLRAYTSAEITDALQRHGFGQVSLYGGLDFGVFDENKSSAVVIEAKK